MFWESFLASLAPASGVISILNPLLYHNILHLQFIAVENIQFSSRWKRPPKVHQSQRDPTVLLQMSSVCSCGQSFLWFIDRNPIRGCFWLTVDPTYLWWLTDIWHLLGFEQLQMKHLILRRRGTVNVCVSHRSIPSSVPRTRQPPVFTHTIIPLIVHQSQSSWKSSCTCTLLSLKWLLLGGLRNLKGENRIKTVGPISRRVWSETINNPRVVRLCLSTASDSHSAPQKAWTSDLWRRGHSFITSSYAERRSELQVASHCLGLRNELF